MTTTAAGELTVTLHGMTTPVLTPVKIAALSDVPHAMPYQGSKRALAHAIARLVPEGTEHLVEPFCGSAAVSLAARYLNLVQTVQLVDVNEPLAALWAEIIDDPKAVADRYEDLWNSQGDDASIRFGEIRTEFNRTHEPAMLLYLLYRCVKAAVRYNKKGEFSQSSDKRRRGTKPDRVRRDVTAASKLLQGSNAEPGDYVDWLVNAAPDTVVYMDPPYQGTSNSSDHRYMAGVPFDEFVITLRKAVDNGVSFLLSYDGSTGDKIHGEPMPDDLGLLHVRLNAGRSSQATLQGLDVDTIEALYVSPALTARLGGYDAVLDRLKHGQALVQGTLL